MATFKVLPPSGPLPPAKFHFLEFLEPLPTVLPVVDRIFNSCGRLTIFNHSSVVGETGYSIRNRAGVHLV